MKKNILKLFTLFAMLVSAPQAGFATPELTSEMVAAGPEQDLQQVQITVKDGSMTISGANGQTAQIYNLTGTLVAQVKIDSQDKTLDLGLKGCYIVKVGKVVRKINIK